MPLKRQLNRNEMECPPSPEVLQAMRGFDPKRSAFYFDGYYGSRLAPVLARRFKIPEEQVSVGYGIEFFLRAMFDACDPKKDVVLTNAPHFGFYSVYAKTKQVRLVVSELVDRGSRFEFNIGDFLEKIKAVRPKIVLITSPNNPTGNSISPNGLAKILHAAPKTTLVALDEAYWGFDNDYDEAAFLQLLKKHNNLAILRSFSKRYALAGLRIGFAFWGKQVKEIIKYEDLYLGGSQLLEEIAVAALASEPYYKKFAQGIIADRDRLVLSVNRLKHFRAYDSNANFVFIKVEKKTMLDVAIAKFVAPEYMRVSLGSRKHIAGFIKALERADGGR